jgi:predicted dehydrogenase
MADRKLRMGMVGGGIGAFIGPVHHMAATLDHQAELVAGAFSRDAAKARASGEALLLDPSRVYASWQAMLKAERALPDDRRVDFISIVVPNNEHFEIAKGCLEAGFNVICDKPMTTCLKDAKALARVVARTGKVFALTHNYTGYPMVKQARAMCRLGQLGRINKVVAEFPQGWMVNAIEHPQNAIGGWRGNPKVAGPSCCMGDLGTHAENLLRYITGLEIETLCADLSRFVPSNGLEDDGNVLVRFRGGARGILFASQISAGEENPLAIRIYGTKMGLEWRQEDPNYLWQKNTDGTITRLSKGNDNLCEPARKAARLIWGHPDGFIEAFANIYREAYRAIRAERAGQPIPACDFPTVQDGVTGVAFIETVVASSKSKAKWTRMAR